MPSPLKVIPPANLIPPITVDSQELVYPIQTFQTPTLVALTVEIVLVVE